MQTSDQPGRFELAVDQRWLPELDGLRTIAITLVLLYHVVRVPVPHHAPLDYPTRIFAFGWGGVDIFFVLSGFLITGILLRNKDRQGALPSFLIRRFVRIVPLYLLVIASFYALQSQLANQWMFDGQAEPWSYLTLTQNIATALRSSGAWYLGPTWSLAVEVQIYLIMGVLVLYTPRSALLPIACSGVILALAMRLVFWGLGHQYWGYFLTPARVDGACLGTLAAIALRSDTVIALTRRRARTLQIVCFGLIAAATISAAAGQGIGSVGAAIFGHLGLSIASAVFIVLLICRPGAAPNRLLSTRPMAYLGRISYGIYLLHLPVTGTIYTAAGRSSVLLDGPVAVLLTTVSVMTTVLLAGLSYRFVESPLNMLAHRLTQPPARAPATFATKPSATATTE